MSSPRPLRELKKARPVLVRADDGGIWTGRLSAWERIDEQWHGHVVWMGYTDTYRAVVPAARLRPFEERWCEAQEGAVMGFTEGRWYPGRLTGMRRRPGAIWEGLVEQADTAHPVPQWVPMGAVRIVDKVPQGAHGGEAPF